MHSSYFVLSSFSLKSNVVEGCFNSAIVLTTWLTSVQRICVTLPNENLWTDVIVSALMNSLEFWTCNCSFCPLGDTVDHHICTNGFELRSSSQIQQMICRICNKEGADGNDVLLFRSYIHFLIFNVFFWSSVCCNILDRFVFWNDGFSMPDKMRVDISVFSHGFISGCSVCAALLFCFRGGKYRDFCRKYCQRLEH